MTGGRCRRVTCGLSTYVRVVESHGPARRLRLTFRPRGDVVARDRFLEEPEDELEPSERGRSARAVDREEQTEVKLARDNLGSRFPKVVVRRNLSADKVVGGVWTFVWLAAS